MEKEEIKELEEDIVNIYDILYEYKYNHDYGYSEKLCQFLEKYSKIKMPEVIKEQDIEKALKTIMMRIENGDYEYFLNQLAINGGFVDLMQFSSKKRDIKAIIESIGDLVPGKTLEKLILATDDLKFIEKCIMEDVGKFKINNKSYFITNIIIGTNNFKFIKKCIKNRKKLGLGSFNLERIIISTNDIKFIKKCIRNRKKLDLKSRSIKCLIEETNDIEFIKKCRENPERFGIYLLGDMPQPAIKVSDIDYIEKCIKYRENLGLRLISIKKLIRINNEDYIKILIKDRKKLDLDVDFFFDLIDLNSIEDLILYKEDFKLKSEELVKLILINGDLEFIEKCLKNAKELNLSQREIKKLNLFTDKENINLPKEMTIGVEIESEGKQPEEIEDIIDKIDWITTYDGSLNNGAEINSPILTGDQKNSSNEIRRACAILNGLSQETTINCGGHIHIGATYLDRKSDWINFILILENTEKILYTIGNEKGNVPRCNEYAVPISKKIEDSIENGTINLESEEDLKEFAETIGDIQDGKFYSINFLNVGCEDNNTIEFRLPNGTINPNVWIENINLFGGIVRSAHELTIIQEKIEKERTDAERKMLENFEIIQTEKDESQIAMALIELCIAPEQRNIYIDRYTTNKPLLDNSSEVQNLIIRNITTNKIGKKAFQKKYAINGIDYNETDEFTGEELIQNQEIQEETRKQEDTER